MSSNTLTPFSIVGSSGWLPWPSVSAGNASTLARWPSSISWADISCAPVAPLAPLAPAATVPPSITIRVPVIPRSAWPEIVQE